MEEQNCDYRQIYKIETPQKTGKRGIRGFKIWLVVLLCIAAFGLIIGLAVKSLLSDSVAAAPAEPYVGVLYVEGVIARGNVDSWGRAVDYQHDFTLDAIDDLIGDSNNKALILWVDSPGGGVYESDELYFKIKEYRQSTGQPCSLTLQPCRVSDRLPRFLEPDKLGRLYTPYRRCTVGKLQPRHPVHQYSSDMHGCTSSSLCMLTCCDEF